MSRGESTGRGWRDQPRALGCVIVAAFVALTALAFGVAAFLLVLAVR